MSVEVKNRQRTYAISTARLHDCALCMLRAAGVADYDLSIRLTTNAVMSRLNGLYRQQRKSTDVLSIAPHRVFPPHPPPELAPGVRVLGEVVVSVEYVHKYGAEFGWALTQKVERLLAHGICHLLGYDHEEDAQWELMEQKEQQLLQAWQEERRQKKEDTDRNRERRKLRAATLRPIDAAPAQPHARLPPSPPAPPHPISSAPP